MSFIEDTFFGGAEKKAAKQQAQSFERAQDITREAAEQARGDVQNLFPQAQQQMAQGYQGALDVFNQALPQQANLFQQGNVAAQQQLLAGMPQFQNAILGQPVDYSAFQPTQLQQPDFSFANQQLPQPIMETAQSQTPFSGISPHNNIIANMRNNPFSFNLSNFQVNKPFNPGAVLSGRPFESSPYMGVGTNRSVF